jgi:hypothetical protein
MPELEISAYCKQAIKADEVLGIFSKIAEACGKQG